MLAILGCSELFCCVLFYRLVVVCDFGFVLAIYYVVCGLLCLCYYYFVLILVLVVDLFD